MNKGNRHPLPREKRSPNLSKQLHVEEGVLEHEEEELDKLASRIVDQHLTQVM